MKQEKGWEKLREKQRHSFTPTKGYSRGMGTGRGVHDRDKLLKRKK